MHIEQRENFAHIILDRAADETLIFDWKDDAGALIDLSGLTVRVIVKDLPLRTFEPVQDVDPKKRIIIFDRAFTNALGTQREFMIEARHPDGRVDIILRGTVTPSGWTA
jgi:hypothetical protein